MIAEGPGFGEGLSSATLPVEPQGTHSALWDLNGCRAVTHSSTRRGQVSGRISVTWAILKPELYGFSSYPYWGAECRWARLSDAVGFEAGVGEARAPGKRGPAHSTEPLPPLSWPLCLHIRLPARVGLCTPPLPGRGPFSTQPAPYTQTRSSPAAQPTDTPSGSSVRPPLRAAGGQHPGASRAPAAWDRAPV